MDAQIAAEKQAPNGGPRTGDPSPPEANSEVLALLHKTITRLDELSVRIAEVERHIAGQRPDAERFAHEIGPIVLATKGLRDEISKYKDEMKAELDTTRKEVAAVLKQIVAQTGLHRKDIEADIEQSNGLCLESQRMVQQGNGLLQQSMSIYAKSTQSIGEVSQKAARHIETTAQNAGRALDEQTGRLKKNLGEMELTYHRMKEWIIAKTIVIAILSALVGSVVGGLMIGLYTMRRIDAIAEVQRNSAKWEYLIERQNKKNPQDGQELNRQIEQEMEAQAKERAQGTNK